MARVALADSRADGTHCSGGISRRLDLGSKTMARDAVKRCLVGHLGEMDRDFIVAPHGPTRCIHGCEAMHFHTMAGHALYFGQRGVLRFEMNLVAGSFANAPPGFRLSSHVAFLTPHVRNRRVVGDVFRPLRDPQHHLSR